ncbi:MAG: hypothetical protein ABI091_05905 [Ferruginibacter sp.]
MENKKWIKIPGRSAKNKIVHKLFLGHPSAQAFQRRRNNSFKDIDDHLVKTALDQHKEIASQIDLVNADKNISAGIYNKLADIVDAHIRFEERELFPHLETLLSEDALNKIGLQLNNEHSIIVDDYADEFWLKK